VRGVKKRHKQYMRDQLSFPSHTHEHPGSRYRQVQLAVLVFSTFFI
jgi:hypothetical protein